VEIAKRDRRTRKLALEDSMPPSSAPSQSAPPSLSPSFSLALVYIGDDGDPAANFPLGECEGDCDDDDECAVRKCARIQCEMCS
jgi:hypothetical protein